MQAAQGSATEPTPSFVPDDGGRSAAGFRGKASDCGARAAAIVTGRPYADVYAELFARQRGYRAASRRSSVRSKGASPREGLWKEVMDAHMRAAGATWVPLASVGAAPVRVRDVAARWPSSLLVLRLARRYSAMVDAVVRDTWDQHPEKLVYGV